MRITQNMLSNNMLYNLQNNTDQLAHYQEQLSTGKKLNEPSDNPIGTGLVMQYKAQIAQNDQYTQNVNNATSWLNNTDSVLGQATSVLQRARELAVQGATGSNSSDALAAIGDEVEQLRQQLIQVGNSQFNGKYVFNGQKVDQAPYDPNNPSGLSAKDPNTQTIQYQVDDGTPMTVSTSGVDVFGGATATDNAFTVLDNLAKALKSGTPSDMQTIQNSIGLLDSRLTAVEGARSDVGARINRLQLITNRLSDSKLNLNKLLSNTQDANIAEVITNLKTAENVQQASLAAGARILVPTLVDFLK